MLECGCGFGAYAFVWIDKEGFQPLATDSTDNLIRNNRPAVPVTISGGVVVAMGASHTTVTNNQITRNAPDIFWDGTGTANTFSGNLCHSSHPSGLC